MTIIIGHSISRRQSPRKTSDLVECSCHKEEYYIVSYITDCFLAYIIPLLISTSLDIQKHAKNGIPHKSTHQIL